MLDPQHLNFVRSIAEILGGALLLWFVLVFIVIYVQARAEAKMRQRP